MRISFTILFSLFSLLSYSQKKVNSISYDSVKDDKDYGRFRYLEFKAHSGFHIYSGETLSEFLDQGYGSFEVRLGWQPSNKESWANQYGYASYGVGFYSGYIGDPQKFGNPNALFGFVNFPMSPNRPGKRNYFFLSPAVGLTYNLIPYNPDTNPTNDAIGSKVALYFNVNFAGYLRMNRELDFTYGIDFTHFSNGRTSMPNYGLNMFGLNFGAKYNFNADQRKVNNDPFTHELLQARYNRPETKAQTRFHKSSININEAVGTVQNMEDAGTSNRYMTNSFVIDYRYRFSTMHGITAGLDWFYDGSLVTEYPDNQMLYGVHVGYDFMFWKFAIRAALGTYLGDDKGKDQIFARVGLNYSINSYLQAQVALKTKNGFAADWVEYGVIVRPFKW